MCPTWIKTVTKTRRMLHASRRGHARDAPESNKDTGRAGRRDRGRRDPRESRRALRQHGGAEFATGPQTPRCDKDTHNPPLQEPGSTSRKGPTTTSPTKAGAGLWALFRVAPLPALGVDVHPSGRLCLALQVAVSLSLTVGSQTRLPTCVAAEEDH